MKNIQYQCIAVVTILLIFTISCAPPDPNGEATISSNSSDFTETYSGSAFDGITSTIVRYTGRIADDGLTEAESEVAKYNELSGRVQAECTDLTHDSLTGDQARATSNNQVRTKLTITKKRRPEL